MYEDTRDDEQPQDEAQLRRIQRSAMDIRRRAIAWADRILDLLPKGLQLTEEEAQLLRLFLAQQRRLNLEMDDSDGNEGLLARIAARLSLRQSEDRSDLIRAAHKLAFSYLEQAIEATVERFCAQYDLSLNEPAVIDWRVAVRYTAQQIHHIGCRLTPRDAHNLASPLRFALIVTARDMAVEVVAKRSQLLDSRPKTAASTRSPA